MRILFGALTLLAASAAQATQLSIPPGENWIFTLKDGQPTLAHKVAPTAKPAKGEIMVSVRALFGTAMIVTNNSRVSYTFTAELLNGGKAVATRPCTLPGGAKPILEQWEQKADAVRVGNFRAAGNEGHC